MRNRFSPTPISDIFLAEEPVALQVTEIGEADGTAARARWAPLVFLSLLGLAAAVALVYLVHYAGDNGTGPPREIASPHRQQWRQRSPCLPRKPGASRCRSRRR